jgi:nucleotide-binding universal stress UspA family protein
MFSSFSKAGLAVTFSPTGKALLSEAARLQVLFDFRLYFLHVGDKDESTVQRLTELISENVSSTNYEIVWLSGEPAKAILKSSKELSLDLLIIGALEKESGIKNFLGSVARNIMRNCHCPILVFTKPEQERFGFKNMIVSVCYDSKGEKAAKAAVEIARHDHPEKLSFIKEINVPGLPSVVFDSGSRDETGSMRRELIELEKQKIRFFARELGLHDNEFENEVLYGIEGWECLNYAADQKADLLVVAMGERKLSFIDRIFMHDMEFLFERIPTNTLLYK